MRERAIKDNALVLDWVVLVLIPHCGRTKVGGGDHKFNFADDKSGILKTKCQVRRQHKYLELKGKVRV